MKKKRRYIPPATELIPICDDLLAGYGSWLTPDGETLPTHESEGLPEGVNAKPAGPGLWNNNQWDSFEENSTWDTLEM